MKRAIFNNMQKTIESDRQSSFALVNIKQIGIGRTHVDNVKPFTLSQ